MTLGLVLSATSIRENPISLPMIRMKYQYLVFELASVSKLATIVAVK